MPRLKQKLLSLLKDATRIAVVGIGSELRGDDAAGLLVLKHLQEKVPIASKPWSHFIKCDRRAVRTAKKSPPAKRVLKLFNGGTAPENLTGEIRRFKPGHLIMIDAVELRKRPGTMALVDLKQVENTAFLTHKLPLKLMLDYLAFKMPIATEINSKATTATCPSKLAERSRKPEGRRRVAAEMDFTTVFIGIQPKNLDFGTPVSKEVKYAARQTADLLLSILN